MKRKNIRSLFLVVGTILTVVFVVVFCEWRTTIQKEDLVIHVDRLTDDPVIMRSGGRNPVNFVRVRLENFQGRDFRIPLEFLKENELNNLISNVKWEDTITVGFLKSDFRNLRGMIRSPNIYVFQVNGRDFLDLDHINADKRDKNSLSLLFVSVFLIFSWSVFFGMKSKK